MRADESFTIVYVGTIWPAVLPTLRTFLQAIACVRDTAPGVFSRLRVRFIGTTGNANNNSRQMVVPLAEQSGVAEAVEEVPQRLPFIDALSLTSNAGANLLLGSDEPHYTPSKVIGILMAGRPYISLLHEKSSARAICMAAGGGIDFSFRSAEDLTEIVPRLADAIIRMSIAPESRGPINARAYTQFEASAVAARFAQIFDEATGRHS
jgi:glycine/D-amino acid oxidase-like deaminating enzyme